ncbi:hypothetical protein L3X38_012179 [Prunus dulcis]|uniref:BED-type domain-containing protein n=1 Tax=Prunus dulcis TaxID=3755 RepID=A0AAD4ZEZ6_PRUDU|nr:hypothetical protein L3X38_012179 [Prunus dulcis]
MDQCEQLPSNSNEVCSSSASASASASSPSPTIPITQHQAQTPPQHSGLPPLPPLETRKSSREKSEVWDHFEKYDDVVETVKKDGSKSLTCKKRARCKYCFTSYATDPNLNGMSSLKKHIESTWELNCKLLETCLLHWDLKKILTITADNASSNTKAIDYLKSKMGHWKNGSLVLEGKYMHVRCCAHIVNLIVRDGLKKLEKSILAIRNAVRYVRSSPQRLEEFKTCVLKEQIECKGLVVLDVPTRWNSTYLMLDAALKFEKAFVRMGEDDDAPFASWFGEDEPVFYDMTLKMSVSLHPASHTTFHNLIAIEGEIGDLFFGEQLPSETHTSTVLKDMACSMKVKFEKYWGDLDKVNQLLMVALVLDPRYKLGNLEFVLKRRFENPQDATKKKNEVKELLMKLYEEYAIPPPPTQCTSANGNTSSTSSITLTSSSKKGGGKHLWEMEEGWIKESQASNTMILEHEVDRYLTDPIEKMVPNFDILKWWKLNGVKYPSLSLIAKDVLAIPVSTVASESCFSTSGRVINSFRASLTPKIVEALICSQNWSRSDDISVIQYEPTIQEMEFYESIESDLTNLPALTNSSPSTFQ